jgi:large subunit ribosomal protein L5e
MLTQVHEKIREDPEPEKKEREKPDEAKRWKTPKLTYDERKAALKVRRN